MTHWRLESCGVKGRAAFAGERIGERWEQRRELAGGEGVQGPEALGKLEGGQAAVAIELAEKVLRRLFPFLRIAFETAGDEVFVGIAPQLDAWHDVVEALNAAGGPAQTIKASASLARMDDLAEGFALQEIGLLEVGGAGQRRKGGFAGPGNLLGQAHLDHVTGFAAFDQAENALVEETAHRLTRGSDGEASTPGEPGNGKAEAELPFEAGMAQEMRIDRAVDDGEAEARDEIVFQVFPELFGVGFFVFHGLGPEWEYRKRKSTVES